MAKHPATPVHPSGRAPGTESTGFNGELRCASLADLIQLECLSGAREAVAVTSQGRKGHLFFEGGAMVHARTATQIGVDAAFEILSWSTGTFSGSELPWPVHNTITIPWQQLLMEAARRSDERGRLSETQASGTHVTHVAHERADSSTLAEATRSEPPSPQARDRGSVAPDPVRPTLPAAGRASPAAASGARKPTLRPPPRTRSPEPRSPEPAAVPASVPPSPGSATGAASAIKRAVRFDDSGAILAQRGDAEALARMAPALKHAIDALGAVLGFDRFRSFDATSSGRQLMVYRDSKDTNVALETTLGANLDAVRAALKH